MIYEPIQRCHRYLDDALEQQQQQQRQSRCMVDNRWPLVNHDEQANQSTLSDGWSSFRFNKVYQQRRFAAVIVSRLHCPQAKQLERHHALQAQQIIAEGPRCTNFKYVPRNSRLTVCETLVLVCDCDGQVL